MIILSLQTKLGDKVGILVDRVMELWEGKRGVDNKNKQGSGTIKVSQPISQNQNQMAMRETFTDGTSIGSLPTASPKEELPYYNKMYGGKQTPWLEPQLLDKMIHMLNNNKCTRRRIRRCILVKVNLC